MNNFDHWCLKLAAWTHDPAEKALVLLRDPAGHEGGTVAALQEIIFGGHIPGNMRSIVSKADHWASAADRPNYPRDNSGRYQPWAQVRFTENPELIHPLSGETYNLGKLNDIEVAPLKAVSLDHFKQLLHRDTQGNINSQQSALALWRFGPYLEAEGLEALWPLLPADTRVPDHSIWSHLDLTAAFASAMVQSDDRQPALLTMSFGPVQSFIAQARSTSDLWAGSHLLSRLVWEGLTVICEAVGPDAVIFPQLRGVALVDAWLQESMHLNADLFKEQEWRNKGSDENPLFAAALPNKFTVLAPASRARELAEKVIQRVRAWIIAEGELMLGRLLQEAGINNNADFPCWQQLREQLADFPEVHWAVVPWSLVTRDHRDCAQENQEQLKQVLASFIPHGETFLDREVWKLLSGEILLDGASFYTPNPGLLYPALYDLLDRLAASAKAVRPFRQLKQTGYRCTLTGEHEWLTTDRDQLIIPPTKRKEAATLWNAIANTRKFGVKPGEHLGAIGMIKRIWPRHFSAWAAKITGRKINRFVVSTHTLAMASCLQKISENNPVSEHFEIQTGQIDGVVLPKKLVKCLPAEMLQVARGFPALMDIAREKGDEPLRKNIERELAQLNGGKKAEAYFAMLYMDGDKMGAWIADSWPLDDKGNKHRLTYRNTWHPRIRAGLDQRFTQVSASLTPYLSSYRAISPARHMSISNALNSFALHIARHVVEECYMGKLLYAGGDDIMAMVSVKDLLPCMFTLRLAYSGVWPQNPTVATETLLNLDRMDIRSGHVRLGKKLHRVMGYKATAMKAKARNITSA